MHAATVHEVPEHRVGLHLLDMSLCFYLALSNEGILLHSKDHVGNRLITRWVFAVSVGR
jgi:hypothetical protein